MKCLASILTLLLVLLASPTASYQLERADIPNLDLIQVWSKDCWLDDDCNDGIQCTGKEWCCSPRGQHWWVGCEPGRCYKGPSPCGTPVSAVLAVCDKEWDMCRGCHTDEECNVDTKYTHVSWNWCGGPRRCGGEDEGHHYGLCLGAGPFPCEWDEVCNEELRQCELQPECRHDLDCEPERLCGENGKCNQ